MFRGFRQIAFLTVISRIFGMVRDMAYSHFFGLSVTMDIWGVAFMVPNLSRRIFGEGAASSSLIPIYSEVLKEDRPKAFELGRTAMTVVFSLLTVVVLLGEISLFWYCRTHEVSAETQKMLVLVAMMLPYMCLICTVAIMAGLLNSHHHFAMPAAAPIALNLIIIATICVTGWLLKMEAERQVYYLAVSVVLAGVAQVLMQAVPLMRCGIRLRPAWNVKTREFKRVMLLMGPMIIGLTVTQLNTLADGVIAKWLSGPEHEMLSFFGRQVAYPVRDGAVGSLYFSQRLYQFPLGVLGISLATAIFPVLSAAAADNDRSLQNKIIRQGIGAAVFVAIPAAIGLFLVSRPLTALIYQHGEFTAADTRRVQFVLLCYSVGLCGYFLQQVVTRAFYSIKESKWPARTAVIAVIVNIILNLTLIWYLGAGGLALATAICSYLQVVILLVVLGRQFHLGLTPGVWRLLGKTLAASVVMTLAGLGCQHLMSGWADSRTVDIVQVLALVIVCGGVYAAVSKWLANPMLELVFRKRKKR